MIDDYPKPTPGMDARADRLNEFQKSYEVVFTALRVERGYRNAQRNAAIHQDKVTYWQSRVNEMQTAIDSLIRLKDLGKIAMMEAPMSVVEEYAQPGLLEQSKRDPKSLGY